MEMNEVAFEGGIPVEGYGPGFFRLQGEVREGPLLLLPTGPAAWDGTATAPLLSAAPQVDVLFYGTGAEIAHPPVDLRARMEEAGVGLEPMSTPSACRTFNVLLGEGRRVGLAALPV
ncbi:MAG: Mth938-like domain-containing protein [Shimia sp.]